MPHAHLVFMIHDHEGKVIGIDKEVCFALCFVLTETEGWRRDVRYVIWKTGM